MPRSTLEIIDLILRTATMGAKKTAIMKRVDLDSDTAERYLLFFKNSGLIAEEAPWAKKICSSSGVD